MAKEESGNVIRKLSSDLLDRNRKIKSLENELNELKSTTTKHETETHLLKTQLAFLEEENLRMNSLRWYINAMQTRIVSSRSEIQSREKTIKELKTKVASLRANINASIEMGIREKVSQLKSETRSECHAEYTKRVQENQEKAATSMKEQEVKYETLKQDYTKLEEEKEEIQRKYYLVKRDYLLLKASSRTPKHGNESEREEVKEKKVTVEECVKRFATTSERNKSIPPHLRTCYPLELAATENEENAAAATAAEAPED